MSTNSKPTILNVDDDPSGRYATTRILRREGFHVKEAATGEEALRLVREQPDLVLLDVHLPDMNGFEVCRQIKENEQLRSIPVLHLSATSTSSEERVAGLSGGADGYLTQPVDPALLVATINALLRARRAEDESRDALSLWQVTFDAVSHGVCLINAEGRVQRINRAMASLLDATEADLVGRPYAETFPNAAKPQEGWPFELARKTLQRESAEVKAGARWLLVTADPILDKHGQFAGAVRTVVDITARKRADEEREALLRELEDERARLESVVQQMPGGLIIAEAPSGRLLLRNRQVEAILRGPFRTGRGIEDYLQYPMFHPDGKAYLPEQTPLARTIATGAVVTNEEMTIERGDKSRCTVLANSAPVRNRDGFIVAAVLVLHDVSERKSLEEQVRQSHKMEAMGRLAGGVAHDFNNLLTIIGGYGQMVLDSLPPKDPLRGDLEAVMEASGRATALTRQLLTFSRRQVVQPKLLDPSRQVSKMGRILRRVLGEDVELKTVLQSGAPKIKADPAQIEQVLLNIAGNARDAMPKGGTLTISTTEVESNAGPPGLKPGRYVLLSMADTGTGMNAETKSHLFEPFFTTKGKGKGTGLGLSTVYGIVKQAGGDIAIDTEPGAGTTVRIYWPVADDDALAAERPVAHRAAKTGTETILVVEDEPEVLRLASEMLTRQGYTVIEAGSGPEALRIWEDRRESIDMVLTDVIMPQMSGPELASKLRAIHPDIKVMYMSGYSDDVIAGHGAIDTRTALIHKPFTLDALARKVRTVLDERTTS